MNRVIPSSHFSLCFWFLPSSLSFFPYLYYTSILVHIFRGIRIIELEHISCSDIEVTHRRLKCLQSLY